MPKKIDKAFIAKIKTLHIKTGSAPHSVKKQFQVIGAVQGMLVSEDGTDAVPAMGLKLRPIHDKSAPDEQSFSA